MSNTISDLYEDGESNCCGTPVITPDICEGCREHCGIVKTVFDGQYFTARLEDGKVYIEPYTLSTGEIAILSKHHTYYIDKIIDELNALKEEL